MFVARRELTRAKGRFGLIVAVVALMTLLTGFLSGLAGGLAAQNVSAVLGTGADRVVLAPDATGRTSFERSQLTAAQVDGWRETAGIQVVPLTISRAVVEPVSLPGGAPAAGAAGASDREGAMLLGAPAGSLADRSPEHDGQVVLSASLAKALGVGSGAAVRIAGVDLVVAAVGPDDSHAHQPVAWLTDADAASVAHALHQAPAGPTALLVRPAGAGAGAGSGSSAPDWAVIDARLGTVSAWTPVSLLSLESFKSEIGSLGLMIGLLFLIGALVVGVFFLVWSMQRQRDFAVLKALGASAGWLRRDAFGQALLVLLAGAGTGALLALGFGLLVSGALPFLLSPVTIAAPALAMVVTGLVGSLVALRVVTKADPLEALAATA